MTSKNICFTLGYWVELPQILGLGFSVQAGDILERVIRLLRDQRPGSIFSNFGRKTDIDEPVVVDLRKKD